MMQPPIFTHIAYGYVLGGPGAWDLVGYGPGDQVRLSWFDEAAPGGDFADCADLRLAAELGVDHNVAVHAVVEVSAAGWTPYAAGPPVPAGQLGMDEVEQIRARARTPRYALVALDSIVDCDDTPVPSMWINGGSQWDTGLDRALDALGLKVPGMGDWFWFRTI